MSCPIGCYLRVENIRVRPVYELDACLVYTPDDPNLYSLTPTAWLILELCDGRDGAALEAAYYAAIEPLVTRDAARRQLREGLEDLCRKGIIATAAPAAATPEPSWRGRP